MHRTFALAAIGCAGCHLNGGFDQGATVDLYETGSRLRIVGCDDRHVLGCDPPAEGVTMSATVDGDALAVPLGTSSAPDADAMGIGALDLLLDSGSGNDFELEIASPVDPTILFTLGSAAARATEAPAFSIDAPAHIERSAGPVTITWQVLDGTSLQSVYVVNNCDVGHVLGGLLAPTGSGQIAIDFVEQVEVLHGAGPCTHVVHIDQHLPLTATGDIDVEMTRIGLASIGSD